MALKVWNLTRLGSAVTLFSFTAFHHCEAFGGGVFKVGHWVTERCLHTLGRRIGSQPLLSCRHLFACRDLQPGKEMLTLEVARVDCQKYFLMILKRIEAREYLKPHQLTARRRVDILFTSFTPPYQTDKRLK